MGLLGSGHAALASHEVDEVDGIFCLIWQKSIDREHDLDWLQAEVLKKNKGRLLNRNLDRRYPHYWWLCTERVELSRRG